MGERGGEVGAARALFDDIDWVDERALGKVPAHLIDEAERLGARRKRLVEGAEGFYMNYNVMPAGYVVPPHSHSHSEMLVVLEGGCVVSDGSELGPRDSVVIAADHEYGFTCGDRGMTFLTIRMGDADVTMA